MSTTLSPRHTTTSLLENPCVRPYTPETSTQSTQLTEGDGSVSTHKTTQLDVHLLDGTDVLPTHFDGQLV